MEARDDTLAGSLGAPGANAVRRAKARIDGAADRAVEERIPTFADTTADRAQPAGGAQQPAGAMPLGSGPAPRGRVRSRRWLGYWIGDPLVGAVSLGFYHLLRALPVGWGSAVGAAAGRAVGRWQRAATARARRNYIALSPTPVGAAEADAAMDRMWAHFGRLIAEFAVADQLWRAGRVEVVGLHHLAAARDAGRPHLMMGLHLGNWEVFGAAMYALGFPGKFTYLPPPNRFQHRLALRARRHWGKALPPDFAGSREAWRTLAVERAALVIWVDEFVRGRGVTAPLFGRPLQWRSNLVNITRLTLASGAALLPFYVERLDGARFRLTILPEVEVTRTGHREIDLRQTAERIDRLITPIVAARLDQWLLLPYLRLP